MPRISPSEVESFCETLGVDVFTSLACFQLLVIASGHPTEGANRENGARSIAIRSVPNCGKAPGEQFRSPSA